MCTYVRVLEILQRRIQTSGSYIAVQRTNKKGIPEFGTSCLLVDVSHSQNFVLEKGSICRGTVGPL